MHVSVSDAGRQAAAGVERELADLRQRYPQRLGVTIARRDVRMWLLEVSEGKGVGNSIVTGQLVDEDCAFSYEITSRRCISLNQINVGCSDAV